MSAVEGAEYERNASEFDSKPNHGEEFNVENAIFLKWNRKINIAQRLCQLRQWKKLPSPWRLRVRDKLPFDESLSSEMRSWNGCLVVSHSKFHPVNYKSEKTHILSSAP